MIRLNFIHEKRKPWDLGETGQESTYRKNQLGRKKEQESKMDIEWLGEASGKGFFGWWFLDAGLLLP